MQPTKLILIAALLTIAILSCTKEPGRKPVYFNEEFKSAFNYQVGSYWVFYDSLNNRKDSLSVLDYLYRKPFFDNSTPNENASIQMQFFASPATTDSVALSILLSAPTSHSLFFGHVQSGISNSFQYPTDFVYGIPFYTGRKSIDVGDFIGFYESSYIGNLKVNGITYSNVYRAEYNNTHLSAVDVFYFNADNGFLKISFHNQYVNRELYLVQSHAIK